MSQCHGCAHLRRVPTKSDSVYLQCTEPPRAFYPRQPVHGCPVFQAKPTESDDRLDLLELSGPLERAKALIVLHERGAISR